MKAEVLPEIIEIIEIIDDDRDAFGYGASTQTDPATPDGPRWVGSVVAAAVLAVVGFGIVSSAVTSDPAAPSTPGVIDPHYYVAEPLARGFSMYFAEDRDQDGPTATDFSSSGVAELWATNDASATTGAWFVVSQGHHHATGRNSYRTIVDGIEVVVEHDQQSRQSRLSFTKNGSAMEITAFGWLDRQLVRLVRSVSIEDSVIYFSSDFFATDHTRVLQSDPEAALFGLPAARVGYTTGLPASLAESFTITVAGDNIARRSLVEKFALTNTTTFMVGDLPAIVGQSAADPTVSIAQWRDGERLITVRGNIDIGRMVATASSVHESSRSSVDKLLVATTPPVVAALQVEPATIASGILDDGRKWMIQVSARGTPETTGGYVWWFRQSADTATPMETRLSLPSGSPTIESIVEDGLTYVVAKVPRSMARAQLHVNPTGEPSTVSSLTDINPDLADLFTAAVFPEAVPFTARIVDGNGTTVASWPPTR
jgi:hypothetical protein